jgi:hypothetical protein
VGSKECIEKGRRNFVDLDIDTKYFKLMTECNDTSVRGRIECVTRELLNASIY